MKKFESLKAKCPFYLGEHHQQIYCEGIKKGTTIHVAFGSATKYREHKDSFCCAFDNYKNCLIAKALNSKYDI